MGHCWLCVPFYGVGYDDTASGAPLASELGKMSVVLNWRLEACVFWEKKLCMYIYISYRRSVLREREGP